MAAELPKVAVRADTRGRLRTSREQRRLILAEYARSGLSGAEFARRTGVKYSTFAGWAQRVRGPKRAGRIPPVRLLEAVMAPAPPGVGLLVQLPCGARLELREASQVPLAAALLHALEKPC